MPSISFVRDETVLQNLVGGGFSGAVYPVIPMYRDIAGTQCFESAHDLPETVDLAVVCTPDIARECGEAGILGLVILSARFRESSKDGEALEAEVLVAAKQFNGMRIIGPNCLGIMAPHVSLNASFASNSPPKG